MSTDEIWIIGTDPPCPRCDFLNRMVVDIVNDLELPVNVRHVGYTSAEARQFAANRGLTPGTAKDVAQKMEIAMDWQAIYDLIDASGREVSGTQINDCFPTAAAKWTPELDAALHPCEKVALDAGIMMTPVLVINGKPIHQGSVPDSGQTREWITAAISNANVRVK